MVIWGLSIFTGTLATMSFGDVGDKKYNVHIVRDFFFLLILSFSFGKYLYGELPISVGGGKPYRIVIGRNLDIYSDSIKKSNDTFSVLYESDSRLLLKNNKGQLFNTKKDDIKTIIILKKE